MYPHRIRLRGPWECQPLARYVRAELVKKNLPPRCRMTLPCRWDEGGLQGFSGVVRYTRDFGYPSHIDAHERLWLTFAGADSRAEVCLNGQSLGRHEGKQDPFEFEVTALLQARNRLIVDVDSEASNGGLWGEVALEVRCSAFLRAVRFVGDVREGAVDLKATGAVAGTSDEVLELFLLLNGKALARRLVQLAGGAEPFELKAHGLKVELAPPDLDSTARLYKVSLDLVQGALICYSVQQLMAFRV